MITRKFDDCEIVVKFLRNFIRTSFKILMTKEFFKDFDQNPFHVLDDHGIHMKFFEDFDQNPGSQPLYPTIQMTIKFFKN